MGRSGEYGPFFCKNLQTLKFLITEERMQDLVKKMLALMNKIPEFVKADQDLLSDMRHQYEEGINSSVKEQCIMLSKRVSKLQNKLDYFLLCCLHVMYMFHRSKLGFYVSFNFQGHIGRGSWHCHLWGSNSHREDSL